MRPFIEPRLVVWSFDAPHLRRATLLLLQFVQLYFGVRVTPVEPDTLVVVSKLIPRSVKFSHRRGLPIQTHRN